MEAESLAKSKSVDGSSTPPLDHAKTMEIDSIILDEEINTEDEKEFWCKLTTLNPLKSSTKRFKEDSFTVGRLGGNTLHINEKRLSSTHCRITRRVDEHSKYIAEIEDL
eukprot:CAMPEP_0115018790 /NCGR_PEP_ID=MMETSP0216-20121206/29046_1 /TAXON_ID=223996 /ORGANISM="Protocruzia adherens, Strain Boccale" /LENGTH=108 /DNA_ID=CAMNT_0002390113 /DNA_START=1 /DNA_END=324 /DNA_ORIENTATION=-